MHINNSAQSDIMISIFGCLNIRSLGNKLDDLLEVRRDQSVDVMFLVETWHDSDSVSLGRLRADGFQVVDRPRPRARADTLATNHGGVAAVAVQGVRLSLIDIGVNPGAFELLCVRMLCTDRGPSPSRRRSSPSCPTCWTVLQRSSSQFYWSATSTSGSTGPPILTLPSSTRFSPAMASSTR